ncbi:hypothetical protein CCP3SC5AM1_2040001 [Gammaproteobacteria bacterium]
MRTVVQKYPAACGGVVYLDRDLSLSDIKWGDYFAVFPPGTALAVLNELSKNGRTSSGGSYANTASIERIDNWKPGSMHPNYSHVIASETPSSWKPDEGYAWVNPSDSSDFSVVRKSVDIDQTIQDIVLQHFSADSKCDVDSSMKFYDDVVYYEQTDTSKDDIRSIKQAACEKYSEILDDITNLRVG